MRVEDLGIEGSRECDANAMIRVDVPITSVIVKSLQHLCGRVGEDDSFVIQHRKSCIEH